MPIDSFYLNWYNTVIGFDFFGGVFMFSLLFSLFVLSCVSCSALHIGLRKTKAEQEAVDAIKKERGLGNKLKQVAKTAWLFVYKFFYGIYKVPRNMYRQIAKEKFNSVSYVKKTNNNSSENQIVDVDSTGNPEFKGKMRFRNLTDNDIYHGSAFQKFLDLMAGKDKYGPIDE